MSPRTGVHTIRIALGVQMRLDLADHLQRLVYMDIFHHDWLPLLPAVLRPGGTFLDVGANVGFFSLLAAGLVGPMGLVIALEPIPRTYEHLLDNIELNRFVQIRTEQLALGETSGTFTLHLPPIESHRDYLVSCQLVPGWMPVTVPCATLDELLVRMGTTQVDLMKIDVEGAEPFVFRGGREVLTNGRVSVMVCELNGQRLAPLGMTPRDLAGELERLGFHHVRLSRGRLTLAALPDMRPDQDYNLIFRHRMASA